jgi:hypothetical protein
VSGCDRTHDTPSSPTRPLLNPPSLAFPVVAPSPPRSSGSPKFTAANCLSLAPLSLAAAMSQQLTDVVNRLADRWHDSSNGEKGVVTLAGGAAALALGLAVYKRCVVCVALADVALRCCWVVLLLRGLPGCALGQQQRCARLGTAHGRPHSTHTACPASLPAACVCAPAISSTAWSTQRAGPPCWT